MGLKGCSGAVEGQVPIRGGSGPETHSEGRNRGPAGGAGPPVPLRLPRHRAVVGIDCHSENGCVQALFCQEFIIATAMLREGVIVVRLRCRVFG